MLTYYKDNPIKRSYIYEDEQCTIYADDWCVKHQKDCLENFDLNMEFFSKLNKEKFEKTLSRLLKKTKRFKQIYDINECEGVEGIYILVLDCYKQMYIGQSKDIKKRILQHWRKRKEFDRLIFGKKENSVLSIDVFGPLDTTRIFVLKTEGAIVKDEIEEELVSSVNAQFLLNRTAGGICGNDMFTVWEIVANRKTRHL